MGRLGGDASRYANDLDRQIVAEPRNPIPYVKRCLLLQRNSGEALETVNKALAVVGDNHLLYHQRGMIHTNSRNMEAAERDFRRAVELEPISFESNLSLATVFKRLKRYQEALVYFDRLIEMNPENFVGWNGRADVEYRTGDYERAERHFTAAIFCAPDSNIFYRNRGMVRLKRGRIEEAFADFEEDLRLGKSPRDTIRAMKESVKDYVVSGKPRDGLRILEKALEFDTQNADTLVGLLGLYTHLKEVKQADRATGKLLEIARGSDNPQELGSIGEFLLNAGRVKEAREVAKLLERKGYRVQVVDLDSQNPLQDQSPLGVEPDKKSKSKLGRNDTCSCGSGKKYKNCCGGH